MRSCVLELILGGCGMVAGIMLSGCTGSLKLPISEASHVKLEASPMGDGIQVSYHYYEVLVTDVYDGKWRAEVKLDHLGTLYDTKNHGSPLARNVELGWEKLWEEGAPTWAHVVRLMNDEELIEASRSDEAPRKVRRVTWVEPRDPFDRQSNLDWHLFMFATPVGW